MYAEVFSGLNEDPKEHFQTIFGENHEELVLVKDIAFHSMCEHHLVPFMEKHMLHISREAERSQDSANWHVPLKPLQKRPRLQERITSTIAESIVETLDPHGVMVVVEAEHMCMTMRGVRKPGAKTVTSAVRGVFKDDAICPCRSIGTY